MTPTETIVSDAVRDHARLGGSAVRQAVETASPLGASVWSDPDTVLKAQRGWIAEAHEGGCLFASWFATKPSEAGWHYQIIEDDDPGRAASRFVDWIRSSVEDPDIELASAVFPTIDRGPALVDLLRSLCEIDDVSLEGAHPWGAMSTVSISFALSADVSSWIMCLSPTDSVPSTRRAPFTELIVRVKDARSDSSAANESGDCPSTVYVADAPTDLDGHDFHGVWRQTERNVDQWLGADDEHYAAARVTCVLPTEEWFGAGHVVEHRLALAEKLERTPQPSLSPTVAWTGHESWTTTTSPALHLDPR